MIFSRVKLLESCKIALQCIQANFIICCYDWDAQMTISQQCCRYQTASATAQISMRICCARPLCSTMLYLLLHGLIILALKINETINDCHHFFNLKCHLSNLIDPKYLAPHLQVLKHSMMKETENSAKHWVPRGKRKKRRKGSPDSVDSTRQVSKPSHLSQQPSKLSCTFSLYFLLRLEPTMVLFLCLALLARAFAALLLRAFQRRHITCARASVVLGFPTAHRGGCGGAAAATRQCVVEVVAVVRKGV